MLDHLHPTAEGINKIPAWFLCLLAPVCSARKTHLFNLSLDSWSPRPGKQPLSILSQRSPPLRIRPTTDPSLWFPFCQGYWSGLLCTDTSIQLWMLNIWTKGSRSSMCSDLRDQLLLLLLPCWRTSQECYDQMNSSCWCPWILLRRSILSAMDIPDSIYNWIVNYFDQCGLVTGYKGLMSAFAAINASIIQGSVVGHPIICCSQLWSPPSECC